ncbi:hypothetical protein JGS6364_07271 [[Clostridium] sordellii]|nr:hypothetical protein JGS6364_07271 [[Clostridium] sordellii] [Paeniclostridium sordellii]CEN81171.1 Uncharacterised protein [[Clostridium] sordellii] [Paeniclostridium sordellii]CEN93537.1 Uncharacterised protein [[Clostridium] sordellii] [Paeniclostridium sordellii]CEN95219.1 Uncharacterised protein [[Clostridium] sordellii] [Paeniclostridium sordellii]CEQ11412.1 Uncharacterised protein [[Clostridium] sordellii] [Paeniclostridium sordellii]
MADFVHAAFPWVAFSIGLALFLTHMNSKNIHQDNK